MDVDQNPALGRLNDSERALLLLLGRGHTAKSIAVLKGLSEAAVNERFRSARRKTGIASSREIARLLVARENRDDFIGLAESAVQTPDLQRQDALHLRRPSPFRHWRYLMVVAVLLVTAILAQQTSVPPTQPVSKTAETSSTAQTYEGTPMPSQISPHLLALHAQVTTGRRDEAWSAQTEDALTQAYRGVPGFSETIGSLGVTCSASLCEVQGATRPGLSDEEMEVFMNGIQVPALNELGTRLKLELLTQSLNSTADDSEGGSRAATVTAYWTRADGS